MSNLAEKSFIEAFILGLSISPTCLFTCSPLIVPYVLSEGKSFARSVVVSANFLFGRLAGYLSVGAFAWYVSRAIFRNEAIKDVISGFSLFFLSSFLIYHSFVSSKKNSCGCGAALPAAGMDAPGVSSFYSSISSKFSSVFSKTALGLGYLTAFNICPPILIAVFRVAAKTNFWSAMLFYLAFFLGSSIYFLAIPFLGVACQGKKAVAIGRVCAVLIGSYYLYQGVFKLVSGYIKL